MILLDVDSVVPSVKIRILILPEVDFRDYPRRSVEIEVENNIILALRKMNYSFYPIKYIV